jgi:hypothetical protein
MKAGYVDARPLTAQLSKIALQHPGAPRIGKSSCYMSLLYVRALRRPAPAAGKGTERGQRGSGNVTIASAYQFKIENINPRVSRL